MSTRRTVSALVLGIAAIVVANAPRAFGQSPCDLAMITDRAGRLDDAYDLYAQLLESKPPPPCAVTGIESVSERRARAQTLVAEARTAKARNDTAGAMAKLGEALKIDPSSKDATALLTDLGGPKPGYEVAEKLFDAGYKDEARAEARRIAKDVAPGTDIPERLRSEWFVKAALGDLVGTLTPGFLFALLLLPVVVVLLYSRHRHPARVAIERLANPSKDLEIGAGLTDMLVDEIQSNGTGRSLEWVSDAVTEQELDVADVLGDQWKWVNALLSKVAARRLVTVKGDASVLAAQDDSKKCEVALTLNVVDHAHRVVGTKTFRRSGTTDAASLFWSLVPQAGSWVTWVLATETNAVRAWAPLGTQDWRSWGLFRLGIWYYDHYEDEKARACFLDAIARDPGNVAARLNLASLDVRDPQRWDIAIERLNTLEQLIPADRRRTDSVWYRAQYSHSVALLERSTHGESATENDRDRVAARDHAIGLVRAIAETQLRLEAPDRPARRADPAGLSERERQDLKALLDSTEGIAATLLASILVRCGQSPAIDPQPRAPRNAALTGLANLRVADANVDDVLGLLLGLRSDGHLPGPAHYNLACLYARAFGNATGTQVTAYLEPMLSHLRLGVEARASLIAKARDKDPAFDAVRNDPDAKRRFLAFLASLDPAKPSSSDLAEWTLVAVA